MCAIHPSSWFSRLPTIQRAINSGCSASRGVSPDQVVFRTLPKSSLHLYTDADPTQQGTTPQQLYLQAQAWSDDVATSIAAFKSKAQEAFAATFAKRNKDTTFDIGQIVWVTYPGSQKILADLDNPQKQKTTKLASRRLLGTITEHDPSSHNNYTVELFRPDDEKLLKRTVHVHRLQPYNAKALTTDLAELVSRVPGTLAPERVLAHSGSTVDDIQFYIQWHGIPSEYSSLEPYSFRDIKGHRYSVGETSVVQQYLADNNIDVYKVTETTDILPVLLPPDPSDYIPDDNSPLPVNGVFPDFKPNDVAYSKAYNDYVIVLQHLHANTSNELYSIRRRDGFTLKVSKKTLLHPAEAAMLNLEPSPELPVSTEHAEPSAIAEPTAPKTKSPTVVKAVIPTPVKAVTFTTPLAIVTDKPADLRERRVRTGNVTLRDIGSSAISSGLSTTSTKGILKRSLGIHKGSPSAPSVSSSMFILMCVLEMGGCHKDLSFP